MRPRSSRRQRLLLEHGQYGRPGVLNSTPGQSPDRPGLTERVRGKSPEAYGGYRAEIQARAPAACPHDDRIAVFEETARLAGWEFDRPPSAGRDLEQAAEPAFLRRRD